MQLTWPSNQQRDNFLLATLETTGRNVDLVYVESLSGCSACTLDPITNTSTNSFCVVCSGNYWIEHTMVSGVLSHITWKYLDKLDWVPGGQFLNGDCQIKFPIFLSGIETVVDNLKSAIVDGRDMEPVKVDKRGSPEINRILITLQERGKNE